MKYAIRRTQKQVEQARKVSRSSYEELVYMERPELQALAKERGIDARQSTEALRKALA